MFGYNFIWIIINRQTGTMSDYINISFKPLWLGMFCSDLDISKPLTGPGSLPLLPAYVSLSSCT